MVELKIPVPFVANVTLPVGVVALDLIAVTVTVQAVAPPITTGLGLHEILADVLGLAELRARFVRYIGIGWPKNRRAMIRLIEEKIISQFLWTDK